MFMLCAVTINLYKRVIVILVLLKKSVVSLKPARAIQKRGVQIMQEVTLEAVIVSLTKLTK